MHKGVNRANAGTPIEGTMLIHRHKPPLGCYACDLRPYSNMQNLEKLHDNDMSGVRKAGQRLVTSKQLNDSLAC